MKSRNRETDQVVSVCLDGRCSGRHVDVGEDIAHICTINPSDVHALLRALPNVMVSNMDSGHNVYIDGVGFFFYKLSCGGGAIWIRRKRSARNK